MLKINRAVPIGQLVRQFLREECLETPLAEYRATQAWEEVVGKGVAQYTRSVEVRGGTMYVSLKSPALRNNLMMGRANLIKRINQAVGMETINSLVLL